MGFDSKKYQAEWYQKNKERKREQQLEWQAKNPGWHLKSLMKRKYGITIEDYDRMVELQEGVCAICLRAPSLQGKQNQRLHVDHSEITGEVRGLLCGSCNRGIGLLRHDVDSIKRAAKYLERYGV